MRTCETTARFDDAVQPTIEAFAHTGIETACAADWNGHRDGSGWADVHRNASYA